ncbi:hypothetical protein GOP47_0008880 [Adiantum capillus-veneris]|uniref:SCP domain-containing protein n=1 Tax=Adiantum capillus-veneris TaxID=13818 RepID=A0A9D4UZ58_ADICA|nr:hypothetical protein GOP47_0008880 [Adiantum capillus-veneris]
MGVESIVCSFVVLLALLAHEASAQQGNESYLAGHNEARSLVGVPAMVWDASLVAYAQRYANAQRAANSCRLLQPSNGPYGENKFWGSPGKRWSGEDAVSSWVALRKFYNARSNTCVPSSQPCGVYTQIVWRNTSSLGCASSVCPDNSTFIMCSYNPPGNIRGQAPF